MQIDSHHHLWQYNDRDYVWMTDEMQVLRRDYLPADLQNNLKDAGVDGSVVVQARQTLDETRWLLSLAAEHSCIRGVVGWVPLVEDSVEAALDEFSADDNLKAVRHVVHDEPDDAFILRDDFNRGVARLSRFGLVYDVLIFALHLENTIQFVDRHPGQPFVVDHIAKPTIKAGRFDQDWADGIRELARRENVTCKLSGVVTEVRDPEWSIDVIRPYWETVLDAFGPSRLMFGTDWPVCLLRLSYEQWVSTVRELIGELSSEEQAAIMAGTATRVYGLS